jgi:hypothetical protein
VQSEKTLPLRRTRGAFSLNQVGGVCADFLEEIRAEDSRRSGAERWTGFVQQNITPPVNHDFSKILVFVNN